MDKKKWDNVSKGDARGREIVVFYRWPENPTYFDLSLLAKKLHGFTYHHLLSLFFWPFLLNLYLFCLFLLFLFLSFAFLLLYLLSLVMDNKTLQKKEGGGYPCM